MESYVGNEKLHHVMSEFGLILNHFSEIRVVK